MPAEIVATATETLAAATAGNTDQVTDPCPQPDPASETASKTASETGTGTATDADAGATDAEIVEQFLHDFLRLLDERTERIQELVDHDDLEAAGVALLSLETSSQMANAIDLVHATRAVRQAVETRAEDITRCLQLMTTTAERTKADWAIG